MGVRGATGDRQPDASKNACIWCLVTVHIPISLLGKYRILYLNAIEK